MSHILLTSGPTRQYLDPVRYLTNASSGRMGRGLAAAALAAGHEVTIVSGPVELTYPPAARVVPVVSTEEMLDACRTAFPHCDGLIAVAAPCDYRPVRMAEKKISKNGQPLHVELVETPDIVATLAAARTRQWMVAFALETHDRHLRAMQKLEKKSCDLIILNGPAAIQNETTSVEILDRQGQIIGQFTGSKDQVSRQIFNVIAQQLCGAERKPDPANDQR